MICVFDADSWTSHILAIIMLLKTKATDIQSSKTFQCSKAQLPDAYYVKQSTIYFNDSSTARAKLNELTSTLLEHESTLHSRSIGISNMDELRTTR